MVFSLSRPGKAERLAEILEGYGVAVALDLAADMGQVSATTPQLESRDAAGSSGAGGDEDESPPRTTIGPGECWIGCAELSAGFRIPELGLWLSTDTELFGRVRIHGRRSRFHGEAFESAFRDLSPDDFVIHDEHGVGKFIGVKKLDLSEAAREFMEIEYRDNDRLYLPLDQLHLVQKFRAGEGIAPKIDKLGGSAWPQIKSRVKRSLREMAGELLELYTARKAIPGYQFGVDTPWQREMEDAFEYEETEDQLAAIQDIKADMEAPKSMDRLLCGDVGYGKTEVSMRAAFKSVMEGKQVGVLAPTTVLAHQHWRTFKARLAAFPVRTELLSRFSTPAERRETLAGISDGSVDITVGTHRLLSRDVHFKDLGLLIVDEEQRFGVRQKERLKALKRHVDVLAMTATPIPRTLQMSLIGVRDLSLIETAPRIASLSPPTSSPTIPRSLLLRSVRS